MWEKKLLLLFAVVGITGLLVAASPYWDRGSFAYGFGAQWFSFFKKNYYRRPGNPPRYSRPSTTVRPSSTQSPATPTPPITSPSTTPVSTIKPTPTPSLRPTSVPSLSATPTPAPGSTSSPQASPRPTSTLSPSVTPTRTPAPTQNINPTPNPSQVLWGAYTGDRPEDGDAFENMVGKNMTYQAIFIGWGSSGQFPKSFSPTLPNQGRTLVIFWEPYGTTLDAINNGAWDSYLAQFAADAKSYAGPVILAPLHEMNGNWDPWGGTVGGNSPEKVISAWRHIYGFFGQAGNVKFGWAPNNESVPNTANNQLEKYYPGDQYVDYVGVDGFNFGDPWQSWEEVFSSSLTKLKAYPKPAIIFSMASASSDQKDEWISQGLGLELAKYPQVVGWIWFNQNKERDWRVNSSTATLEAFKSVLP